MKKITASLALGFASLLSASAHASVLQSGVWNDVSASTVSGTWGFTECYSGKYSEFGVSINGILAQCQGDYLMMAARRTGSNVFEVLAAANYADVLTDTGTGNVTHAANGVAWYYNPNFSWGFAGAGDVVNRTSCDVNGSAWAPPVERDRLCWHTYNGALEGGWRAGGNIDLNYNSEWERVLLVGSAPASTDLPEPASLALFGLGALGVASFRRRAEKNGRAA